MDEARTGKAENPCVRKNDSVNTKIKYFSTFGVGISSGACFLYAFFGISARVFNNFKPVARFSHKIGARCNFPFCNAPGAIRQKNSLFCVQSAQNRLSFYRDVCMPGCGLLFMSVHANEIFLFRQAVEADPCARFYLSQIFVHIIKIICPVLRQHIVPARAAVVAHRLGPNAHAAVGLRLAVREAPVRRRL